MSANSAQAGVDLAESTEQVINIMNQYSSKMAQSPQIGQPVTSNETSYEVDTIRLNVFQKNQESVFLVLTIPTETRITSLFGESEDGSHIIPKYQVADAYGKSQGFAFDSKVMLKPGDYCMGLIFSSEEEANSVVSVSLEMKYQKISNLMISQMIFGLYQKLGFDPSHVLNYPVRSVSRSVPFYRKQHSDLDSVSRKMSEFKESINVKLDELKEQLLSREKHVLSSDQYDAEKSVLNKHSSPNLEYTKIKEERDRYYAKLQEAENYIEDIMQKKDDCDRSWTNQHLSSGTRSIIGRRR